MLYPKHRRVQTNTSWARVSLWCRGGKRNPKSAASGGFPKPYYSFGRHDMPPRGCQEQDTGVEQLSGKGETNNTQNQEARAEAAMPKESLTQSTRCNAEKDQRQPLPYVRLHIPVNNRGCFAGRNTPAFNLQRSEVIQEQPRGPAHPTNPPGRARSVAEGTGPPEAIPHCACLHPDPSSLDQTDRPS